MSFQVLSAQTRFKDLVAYNEADVTNENLSVTFKQKRRIARLNEKGTPIRS